MTTEAAVADKADSTPLFERFFVGIKRDYKLRLPTYKSDITDGLNAQVIMKSLDINFHFMLLIEKMPKP